jgi:hypothetical protein
VWANINPQRVPQDSGLVFVDQNAHRMKHTSPLTPIFAAIDDLGGYDFSGIDIVSDRNNLRKLFSWSTGAVEQKDFRIDVELAGETCLFTRREEKDAETIVGFQGFGRQYEKAATRPSRGCEMSTGHHRIISIVCQFIFFLPLPPLILRSGRTSVASRFSFVSRLTLALASPIRAILHPPSPASGSNPIPLLT